jgi:hypothetical protein
MISRLETLLALVLLALGLSLCACTAGAVPAEKEETGEKPAGETATVEVLAPGAEHAFDGGGLRLTLVEVPFDNRCPQDVQCITAGEARVTLAAVGETGTEDFTVAMPSGGPRTVNTLGYRLELMKLEPYPVSTRDIDPGDYRLHLRCTAGEGEDGERESDGVSW